MFIYICYSLNQTIDTLLKCAPLEIVVEDFRRPNGDHSENLTFKEFIFGMYFYVFDIIVMLPYLI